MMKKIYIFIVWVSVIELCHASRPEPMNIDDASEQMVQIPLIIQDETAQEEAADILQAIRQTSRSQPHAASAAAAASQSSAHQVAAEGENVYKEWLQKGIAYFTANNFSEAEHFFLEPASNSNAPIDVQTTAQLYRGRIYERQGQCDKAVSHFKKAIRLGAPIEIEREAQYWIGSIFFKGCGVPRDFTQAVVFLTRANNLDAPLWMQRSAQFILGKIYMSGGDGVEKKLALAQYFLREAKQPGGELSTRRQAEYLLNQLQQGDVSALERPVAVASSSDAAQAASSVQAAMSQSQPAARKKRN